MTNLIVKKDSRVDPKFQTYPKQVRRKLEHLRDLIFEVAQADDTIKEIEETLKWGEPSYLVKNGSTLRIDWKIKSPNQYAMYFKCTSKLVPTFREVYDDTFQYEKNRAILFDLNDKVPKKELKACIGAALRYHTVKKMSKLGL